MIKYVVALLTMTSSVMAYDYNFRPRFLPQDYYDYTHPRSCLDCVPNPHNYQPQPYYPSIQRQQQYPQGYGPRPRWWRYNYDG